MCVSADAMAMGATSSMHELNELPQVTVEPLVQWLVAVLCVCGDVGREVIRLTHFQGQSQEQGPYLLLTPYTHGVPHVDCEGPCAVFYGLKLLSCVRWLADDGYTTACCCCCCYCSLCATAVRVTAAAAAVLLLLLFLCSCNHHSALDVS
jgi:hypothetical protein